MATTTKSKKAKGRRLQQYVAKKVLEKYPHLTEDDVSSTIMGDTGMDVKLSTAARISFPFAIECKARKAFSVYSHYNQAEINAPNPLIPMCVLRGDRKIPLVVLSLENFLEVID